MLKKMMIALLILSGGVLVCSPFIKESIIGYLSHQQDWPSAEQAQKNNEKEALFDFDAIQPPSFLETLKTGIDQKPKAVIGRITIKSVDIRLPILKGTTNQNLLFGAATMRPDQKMGEGNYPLAGHHIRQKSLLFGPLLDIKKGARIVITDFKKDYIYSVTSKKVMSEMDAAVVFETKEKQITLITCDKAERTDRRLVVKGTLVQVADHQT
ncbi:MULTISPECIES: class A sortase [Bacillus]|uniref:class A sortase n=1 Tax=Bacillus TaxID=1386 RepID=UPI00098BA1FC|nr:class A sortase [Bacillus sonorensis]